MKFVYIFRKNLSIIAFVTFLIIISAVFGGSIRKPSFPYNVIFISVTDLRADHVGVYGYSRDTSPNIDQFAKDSVLFENAFLQGSRSEMNFASIFTSQYPRAHGVMLDGQRLALSKTTLAEVLKEDGYKTVAFVRNELLSPLYGITQGFEVLNNGDDIFGVIPLAADWIAQNREEKLFLFIQGFDENYFNSPEPFEHMFDPEYDGILSDHERFYFTANFKEQPNAVLHKIKTFDGRAVIEEKEKILLNQRDLEHLIAHYDDGVRYADSFVGEVLTMLKEANLYEDSIIVIFSEHGESLDDHVDRGVMDSGQLIGHAQVFEEIIRTPFIISHPELEPQRINGNIQMIDLFPTIIDFLNISLTKEVKNQIQGKSFVSMLGAGIRGRGNEYVYGQGELIRDIIFVRFEQWKLISWQNNFVLYNLEKDPKETNNVINRYPEIVEHLKQKLSEWQLENIKQGL